MTYALFLDDERMPPRDGVDWVVARTVAEAKKLIRARGWPHFISFDHDMGWDYTTNTPEPTGMDFAKYLVELDLSTNGMPKNFDYRVHSANPVGAANICGLMDQYVWVGVRGDDARALIKQEWPDPFSGRR